MSMELRNKDWVPTMYQEYSGDEQGTQDLRPHKVYILVILFSPEGMGNWS